MEATRFLDHYSTLGLRRTATAAEVRRAYRRLVLRYHPDRSPTDPDAPELFQKITEAYQVLSQEHRRREYDALLQAYTQAPTTVKPVARVRTEPRPTSLRVRLNFDDQQNSLRKQDAFPAVLASAFAFPWMAAQTSFAGELAGWEVLLLCTACATFAGLGWRVGCVLEGAVEFLGYSILRWEEPAEYIASVTPFAFSALAPWIPVATALSWGVPIPSIGFASAVFGAAVAAPPACAVGRAFTHASLDARPWLGRAVAVLVAAVLASTVGFSLTAAFNDFLGASFFVLWSCSGGAAAAGGAVAALRGAVHPLGQEP